MSESTAIAQDTLEYITETSTPRVQKKATKKKTVKKTTVAKKHGKKGGGGKKSTTNNSLMVGSTRVRLFRALARFPSGLTATKIKEKTGMLANSGHLAVLLKSESDNGRLRREQHDVDGKDVTYYVLSASGKKDLKSDKVDQRKSGTRIGQIWTDVRWSSQKSGKSAKKKGAKKGKSTKKTAKKS